MNMNTHVLEFKCPCCNAGLAFDGNQQQLKCEYCDNTFDLDTIKAYNECECEEATEQLNWEEDHKQEWSDTDLIHAFQCPACGGEIITDNTTAATFCPFCDNPTIIPSRLSGGLKPDAVIPFQTTKEDAKNAFLNLCNGKTLLPKDFTATQRLEKITGIYVPFWLYDCNAAYTGNYKATRIHHWSDSSYNYTKTDHFLLRRSADAAFNGIPMDGSSKMDDVFMESIEPFDYSQLVGFDMAYLTGFFADNHDVLPETGEERIQQRVDTAFREELQNTILGYSTVIPTSRQLHIEHSKSRYVLLPVWILNTKYGEKIYTFAMNGQTGKMTGTLPACPKQTAAWFSGICACVTLLVTLIQMLL